MRLVGRVIILVILIFMLTVTAEAASAAGASGPGLVRNLHTNMTYDLLQEGIDNATAGDLLVVSAGTFNESIVVNKALTIRAESGSKSVIDGQGAARVVDITAGGVVLDGFVVRGSSSGGYGICGQGSRITIRNCQVTGNGYGIFFKDASVVGVESCEVSQNTCGITFDGTTGSHIKGCTVSSNMNYGISLRASSNDNLVQSNTVTNNGGAGIEVTESDRNILTYDELQGNSAYGVTMHCQDNLVYLNTFRGNSPANAYYDPGSEPDNNLWHSDGAMNYRFTGAVYTGVVGNFWDTMNATDADRDGVSETQYTLGKIADTNPLAVPGSEIKDVQKSPTSTEATSTSWTWLLLMALIPLSGIVIYYFTIVREK